MAVAPDDVLARLEALGIQAKTHDHAPLFTVEESRELRGLIPGLHSKNLFVRDRKKRYFLVSLEEDAVVDLKILHHAIGAQGKVSFGSAEALFELLGVKPGSVSPFGAINDVTHQVTVVLERQLAQAAEVNFHPLDNSRTTTISGPDLLRFLRDCGHEPILIDLPPSPTETEA